MQQPPEQKAEPKTAAQRFLRAADGVATVLARSAEHLLLPLVDHIVRFNHWFYGSKFVRNSISALNIFNPLAVQASLLGVGYGKKPLEKRPIARTLATALSFLPQAAFVATMLMPLFFPALLAVPAATATAAAVMGPGDIAMMSAMFTMMGACMVIAVQKGLFSKKLETQMEETNAAGQRVTGSREDLCALALRQRLVTGIAKRFNAHAAPRLAVDATDLVIYLTKWRRARVTVLEAGDKGAGAQTYEFTGGIDRKSQMKAVATLMTEGAIKDVKVLKPLRLKTGQPKEPAA